MSSFLCFICHSTVNADTNEDTREKYREVVGMNLCPDSHLCHICCHVLNRLWLFRCICLKRSLEYPVLFSEKGTLNLQRNDVEIHTVCFDDCELYKNRNINSKYYHITYFDDSNDVSEKYNDDNEYVELEEERKEFDEFLNRERDFRETVGDYEHRLDNGYCNVENGVDVAYEQSEEAAQYGDEDDAGEENSGDEEFNQEDYEEVDSPTPKELETEASCIEIHAKKKKNKSKKEKKRFEKLLLSVEEQKSELEGKRREKKYIEAEFKCYNCATGFLFKDTYQAHMMRHEESNGEHQCSICSLRFATVAVLRAHTSLHAERHRCKRCGLVVRRRQRMEHARLCYLVQTEMAACHLCGKVFKDSTGVRQHLKRYHRSKDTGRAYSCNVCGESYTDQAAVRTHMLKHVQRKFPCEVCDVALSSPYSLARHRRRRPQCRGDHGTHGHALASRPVRLMSDRGRQARPPTMAVCHLCGASFKGNSKLNRHIREVCEKNKAEEEMASYYVQENV